MMLYYSKDKTKEEISFEFEKLEPSSPEFVDKFGNLSDMLANAYTPVETSFAETFPESLNKDLLLHSLAPLLGKSRDTIIEETRLILKKFFAEGFPRSFAANIDVCKNFNHYLITARDKKSNEPLGVVYFMLSNVDNENIVRIPILGVSPAAQGRGIGKFLVSSILKGIPNVKKITLSTRVTNENALNAYKAWGFVNVKNTLVHGASTMVHWTNLEYPVDSADQLQQTVMQISDSKPASLSTP